MIFEPRQRVERCNSPERGSLVKDGVVGTVAEAVQAANGEMGYFVRFGKGGLAPIFCAGTRLKEAAD